MLVKTSELIGPALDWAVAKCEGYVIEWDDVFEDYWLEHGDVRHTRLGNFAPSTYWAQGGPIIEREAYNLFKHNGGTEWCCACNVPRDGYTAIVTADGATPLIAVMRCFVKSKLGDTVEIPEELLKVTT